jgi:hypothetical protein
MFVQGIAGESSYYETLPVRSDWLRPVLLSSGIQRARQSDALLFKYEKTI